MTHHRTRAAPLLTALCFLLTCLPSLCQAVTQIGTVTQYGTMKEVVGSATTLDGIAILTDSAGYPCVSIQRKGTGVGVFTVEGSADGLIFYPVLLAPSESTGADGVSALGTLGQWDGPSPYHWLQVRASTYSNGTMTVVADFKTSCNWRASTIGQGSICQGNQTIHGFALSSAGDPLVGDSTFNQTLAPLSVGVGKDVLQNVMQEVHTVAVGDSTLKALTTGDHNAAGGYQAALVLTSGSNSTAWGYEALHAAVTAGGNTALGNSALILGTGSNNTAVGDRSMAATTTGALNVGVGQFALNAQTTGSNNTALGSNTCASVTVGHDNICLGYNADLSAADAFKMNLGGLLYGNLPGSASQVGVAIGKTTVTTDTILDLSGSTNSILPPIGTTAQRPATPTAGMTRFNTDTPGLEQYVSGAWSTLAAAGGGSGTVNSGTAGQLAYYPSTGAAVSSNSKTSITNGALTLGVPSTTIGQVVLEGNTSGAATITPQAVAGTPTITLGTSSGTPIVTASAPLAINTTTGNATITGVAGQVLAGATPAFTAAPTLGASGTAGSLTMGNATSGLVTIQPVSGALGTVTWSIPAATDTAVGKDTTDVFTHKTYDTAATGNSFKINGTIITAVTGTGATVLATSPTLVTPVLGAAAGTSLALGTNAVTTGTLALSNGGTLGTAVTVQNNAATTAYNFNLPTTVGSSGQVLTSAAGTTNPMTWTTLATVATSGSAANLTGVLPAASLPNPTASTLGGVESYAAVSNQWINAISTSGVPSSTQPAASNLSNGTTGSGAVALATSPTFVTPILGAASGTSLALGSSGVLGSESFGNATSGVLTVQPVTGALGTPTLSLPAATDILIGKATTDTLTNKTFDTAGAGNSLKINGVAITANTGTGAVVLATSPTLVTPVLGVASGTSLALGSSGVLGSESFGNATSGTITIQPVTGALGTPILSLPAATDTLVAKATTDTFTNKTFDTAATGNVFKINGTGVSAVTGTGSAVLATSPVLTTPSVSGGVALAGSSTGSVTQVAQATAGTPTITWGTTTGTPAVTASSPLAITTATGNITCATCATTTNGGALSGTAPVAVSAAGAISLSGSAGQVPNGATGAFTATPTLGASGTLGSLAMGNATSGTITLQPVTGALGSVTVSLPAATDTLVGKATTDTLTNKTFNTAGTGNVFQINGTGITAVTGTGSAVLATSPTLVTPTLGVAGATSYNATAATSQYMIGGSNAHWQDGATNQNTAIGLTAATTTITSNGTTQGVSNTVVGSLAGNALTTGSWNNAFGQGALALTTTGTQNEAIGQGALAHNVSGTDNIGIGTDSLSVMTGSKAIGIGTSALIAVTGTLNTALGYQAGKTITTGASNVILGPNVASTTLTTGSNNIEIGTNSAITAAAAGTSNTINIGGTGGSWVLTTGTDTNTTASTIAHGVWNLPDLASSSAATTGTLCWTTSTGLVRVNTTVACLASLEEFKNIKWQHPMHGLDIVMRLKPFFFTWKNKTILAGDPYEQPGLGAHHTESVDTRLVGYDTKGHLQGVRYQELTAVLVKAIQEQQVQIDELKRQLTQRTS